ncbi:MAG: hypothetical protein ACOYJG_13500 [Prevotella sp.]
MTDRNSLFEEIFLTLTDSYYFSRLFTKTIGISPKKFRQSKPV